MVLLKNLVIKPLVTGTVANPSSKSRIRSHGFTLIELLIVLVIIGVIAGALSLSLVHRDHSGFSKRASLNLLRSKILLAEQRATILNQTLGLSFSQQGYQFLEYTHTQGAYWQVIQGNGLNPQNWPHGMSLKLVTELSPLPEELPVQFLASPQIVINSSGTLSPFTLYANQDYTLTGSLANDVLLTKQK